MVIFWISVALSVAIWIVVYCGRHYTSSLYPDMFRFTLNEFIFSSSVLLPFIWTGYLFGEIIDFELSPRLLEWSLAAWLALRLPWLVFICLYFLVYLIRRKKSIKRGKSVKRLLIETDLVRHLQPRSRNWRIRWDAHFAAIMIACPPLWVAVVAEQGSDLKDAIRALLTLLMFRWLIVEVKPSWGELRSRYANDRVRLRFFWEALIGGFAEVILIRVALESRERGVGSENMAGSLLFDLSYVLRAVEQFIIFGFNVSPPQSMSNPWFWTVLVTVIVVLSFVFPFKKGIERALEVRNEDALTKRERVEGIIEGFLATPLDDQKRLDDSLKGAHTDIEKAKQNYNSENDTDLGRAGNLVRLCEGEQQIGAYSHKEVTPFIKTDPRCIAYKSIMKIEELLIKARRGLCGATTTEQRRHVVHDLVLNLMLDLHRSEDVVLKPLILAAVTQIILGSISIMFAAMSRGSIELIQRIVGWLF